MGIEGDDYADYSFSIGDLLQLLDHILMASMDAVKDADSHGGRESGPQPP
jgi:hypothetical protein